MNLRPFIPFLGLLLSLILVQCQPAVQEQKNDKGQTTESSESLQDALTKENMAQFAAMKVEPPFEKIQVPFQKFAVNQQKGQRIEMSNGTVISIPQHAFVDKNGNAVKGEVQLHYREFHDAADVIASGIPMRVMTEDGGMEWFQTAGMFEIHAFSKGEAVFIAPGKNLQVDMASHVDGQYDFWYYNENTNNWEKKGSADAQPNPAASLAASGNRSAATGSNIYTDDLISRPVAPVAYNKNKKKLNFELDYEEFPELKAKSGIIWQYAGKDQAEAPENNDWIFDEAWEDISLTSAGVEGRYQLTLKSPNKTYQVLVSPSLSGTDLQEAQADYQQKLKLFEAQQAALKDRAAFKSSQAEFLRSFTINNFGIYNYDLYWKRDNTIPLIAIFEFDMPLLEGLADLEVYLITGNQRAIIKYPRGTWEQFAFDPKEENTLVAVLPGDMLAVFSPAQFKAEQEAMKKARNADYTFKMNVKEKAIKDLGALKKAMSLG
ncbi:MAG TPA: hypothetical protein PKA00_08370 [Saprospiraceae bacterium]|nr:hypothetical protein [Saprospiraceae bacterium]HMQ82909.1 hypothetical protein [Saprospiraceae bacterium]